MTIVPLFKDKAQTLSEKIKYTLMNVDIHPNLYTIPEENIDKESASQKNVSPIVPYLKTYSPISGEKIGAVKPTPVDEIQSGIDRAYDAYRFWRTVPPPRRGELIRLLGEEVRRYKENVANVVMIEVGKILQEALGEAQEMIDICDFAVGLSRQLYGLTMTSERPQHRMMETWHPLGVVGLITPFNFPVAVWSWNFALAIVCGNSTVWKPSEHTPISGVLCQHLFQQALKAYAKKYHDMPYDILKDLSVLVQGGREEAELIVNHPKIHLVSATGSTAMGRDVGQKLAGRFAKSILELGGNNAMIVTPSANLDLAVRAITFSAVGTCGQRCTSLRRLFIHTSLYESLLTRLKDIYQRIPIGDPQKPEILCGPLFNHQAFVDMQKSLEQAKKEGGKIHGGQRVLEDQFPQAYYVQPALVEMPSQTGVVAKETFAPILYIMSYETLEDVIEVHNAVPQGLSSCIFTQDIQEAEMFLSAAGSDCGIVNVNIGPSGAEIGGAFGGEKETGGGRESGSDAWRGYMRRATNTINYSNDLPLAQGISFDV